VAVLVVWFIACGDAPLFAAPADSRSGGWLSSRPTSVTTALETSFRT
jgi:hypothetical protein